MINSSNLLSFCLDVAQGHVNGAPSEIRIHSGTFPCLACKLLHHLRRPQIIVNILIRV